MPELKAKLSEKNKYWIPKHRYYELKHYCLQYPYWRKLYADLGIKMEAAHQDLEVRGELYGRKTENYALIRAELSKGMKLVEECAKEASEEIGEFIFRGVTEGISYTQLRMLDGLPCGQDMYYDRYRRFFYILSQKRGL